MYMLLFCNVNLICIVDFFVLSFFFSPLFSMQVFIFIVFVGGTVLCA